MEGGGDGVRVSRVNFCLLTVFREEESWERRVRNEEELVMRMTSYEETSILPVWTALIAPARLFFRLI